VRRFQTRILFEEVSDCKSRSIHHPIGRCIRREFRAVHLYVDLL
jgi:hypothetical protein